MVKIVLTDESETYMISVANVNGKPEGELFKLDAWKLRREDFFNAVMEVWGEAEKLPVEKAIRIGILNENEIQELCFH